MLKNGLDVSRKTVHTSSSTSLIVVCALASQHNMVNVVCTDSVSPANGWEPQTMAGTVCHPKTTTPLITQVLLKEGSRIGPLRTVSHAKDAAMATVEHITLFSSLHSPQRCVHVQACMQCQTSHKTVRTMSFHMCTRKPTFFVLVMCHIQQIEDKQLSRSVTATVLHELALQ